MGFLIVLIPVGCCLAVPAVLAVAAFVRSRKHNELQVNPKLREGPRHSLLGNPGKK